MLEKTIFNLISALLLGFREKFHLETVYNVHESTKFYHKEREIVKS